MHAISQVLVPTIALLAMVQYCPAPFVPAVAAAAAVAGTASTVSTVAGVVGASGAVAGAIEGGVSAARSGKSKRDLRLFNSRINKREDLSNLGLGTAWPNCVSELKSASLTFSSPSSNDVLVEGLPAACMTLSGVLTNKFNEGNPVPESSSSVKFTNLAPGDLEQIQSALNAHPNYHS